ncbi:MAG: hypothetical protein JWR16_1079 [Nevskia sp.]|nr:hypothetical protein [Nevskia sp.]
MNISYRFSFQDGTQQRINVDLLRNAEGAAPGQTMRAAPAPLPGWTRLDFQQCPNCPLSAAQHANCPAAADLAPTIGAFANIISYAEARVEVETPERTISRDCQVQQALNSLVGLIMSTSACPILGRMRGLARTHLPFATIEETLLRSVGSYLVGQLALQQQGGAPDWQLAGLKAHYAELEVLNRAFKQRVNAATKEDAVLNAISTWGVLSTGVGLSLDDLLSDLTPFLTTTGWPATA